MPRCNHCGNTYSFGSSKTPPVAPSANGLLSGMIGEFGTQNELLRISSMGASKPSIRQAVEKPQEFFDTCTFCGSEEIMWEGQGEKGF